MGDAPREWEGQIVDGIFPLKKYLGGSDHSAVFLTDYAEGETGQAAIKFIPAERASADLILTNWRLAAQMTHPNLLRIFRAGRCRIEGNDLLYLVMEHADEDLADILPERPLAAEEARDMLNPVLDALEYLHGKGFVHGDLKPTNILAAGDQLKLSSDMISRSGETQATLKKSSVYDAPESISGMKTMAGDVWALGTTLVEVLTQKVPEWQPGPHREPQVTSAVPTPFYEIARACLRIEPDRRATVADIAERLNPRATTLSKISVAAAQPTTAPPPRASAAASAGAAAAGAPSSSAGASAVAGTPSAAAQHASDSAATGIPAPRIPPPSIGSASDPSIANSASREPYSARAAVSAAPPLPAKRSHTHSLAAPAARPATADWSKYFGAVIAAALLFAVFITVPRWFRHRAEPSAPAASVAQTHSEAAPNPPSKLAASIKMPAKKNAEKPPKPAPAASSTSTATTPAPTAQALSSARNTDSLQPAIEKQPATSASPVSPQPVSAALDSSKGEILDQVMPDVSAKARATIHGHVRVAVKLHVDAAGAVSDASLDSAGPSAFFADAALQAAHQWTFTPPERNGKSVPSEWLLHFVFTSSDTKVTPHQTAP
jgi:TonB family protein